MERAVVEPKERTTGPEPYKRKDEQTAERDRAAEGTERIQGWKEVFRFTLAVVLIGGFLIILGIAMVGNFTDVPTLAGVFSGWIVAVVAFYFMEQASDRSLEQQAKYLESGAEQVAFRALERAEEATSEVRLEAVEKFAEYESKIDELKRIVRAYQEIVDSSELPELEKDSNV
ncbi:MAG: EI24 domain-containing protein [Methanobacteriota archaeon]|nr:MAG: EI24 domain-containing protein [Euryarchaeota archaeon]